MSSLSYANAFAAITALSLVIAAVYVFRDQPAALIFLPLLALGGPVKALLYDVGWTQKAVDLYPYSLSTLNSVHALFDVILVLCFLFIWFHGAPVLQHREYCHRLRVWSAVIFVTYVVIYWGDAIRSWGTAVTRGGNELVYDPVHSLENSASPLWAIAAAVLVVVSGNRWVNAIVLLLFAFTSLWANGFERGVAVAGVICYLVLTVKRLRAGLVVALLVTGLLAAVVGALTRGNDVVSGQKVSGQALGDLQFLDQSISYFERCSGDLWEPRAPTAFGESFVYGLFMPRFIFRDKPGIYGNHVPEVAIAPVTQDSGERLDRDGQAGGFAPISTWVEMLFDFGLPFGVAGFFGLAFALRWALHAARTNVHAWLFTMLAASTAVGLFRGGSNWLMIILKATGLFALTFTPIELLTRRRRSTRVGYAHLAR